MKRFYTGLLLILSSGVGLSQGTIRYTESVKTEVKIDLPPGMEDTPQGKEIMEQLNKATLSQKVLYFDDKQCVYRDYESPDKKQKPSGGDGGFEIMMIVIQEKVISHHDLTTHKLTESRDIFDKTFIVTDTARKVKWKITNETDTIAGYRCIKATYMKDTVLYQVWFAPDLKVSAGPDNMFGLPGTILKADIDEGIRIIEATSVDLTAPGVENLKMPKKGKKVSKAEYDKILQEKLKERAELEGGGNGQRIQIDIR